MYLIFLCLNLIFQYMKNGTNSWTFNRERINVSNTNYLLKNLEPDTNYKVKLGASNEIGTGKDYTFPDFVRTLLKGKL